MPRPAHALVIGKFYPPHLGHVHLASMAARFSGQVTVVVMGSKVESLALEHRVAWLRESLASFPGLRVCGIVDDLPVDYADPAIWEGHVALMREAIALADQQAPFPALDAVFSSEGYGYELGRRLGVRAVVLDPSRTTCPVSGTSVRSDVPGHWEFLPPAVQAGLCLRVVVLGAESTGTTTLSQDLAKALRGRGGPWERCRFVAEYGRDHSAAMVALAEADRPGTMPEDMEWSEEDFLCIARRQTSLEEEAARCGGPILVMDTDALATGIWHERYRGPVPAALQARIDGLPARDLYVLTLPEGVEFHQDGLRDGEHLREGMTGRFREVLSRGQVPWIEVKGSREERVEQVLSVLGPLQARRWDLADPLPEANKAVSDAAWKGCA